MHDIKYIEANEEKFREKLSFRGIDGHIIEEIVQSNKIRRQKIGDVESMRSELKKISLDIGKMLKEKKDTSELQNNVHQKKEILKKCEEELKTLEDQLNETLSTIPNIPSDDVPFGKSEEDNQEISKFGKIKKFDFKVLDHSDLGQNLGMIDFETASKVTGSRFSYLIGGLAKLERAIGQFMLDQHTTNGYTEVSTPFIVHERSLFGTGNLPKFKDDLFKIEGHDWYLIPTAEVPLTNILRESLVNEEQLPLKFCSFTPCFRSEAGSYGKDTKGLIRQHQFYKVELVNITSIDQSNKAHEEMRERAESILKLLELPFRTVVLCTGDMGFSAQKTYDLEVWLPAQKKYREISSISNCGDFQARRANMKYKDKKSKKHFVHTLNGSGLAVGRTLLAVMENYQNQDGSISIPEVLRPYMNGMERIKI